MEIAPSMIPEHKLAELDQLQVTTPLGALLGGSQHERGLLPPRRTSGNHSHRRRLSAIGASKVGAWLYAAAAVLFESCSLVYG